MATQTIDHNTLSQLIDAGTNCDARIVGQGGGWIVRVQCGASEQTLMAQRSRQIRLFRKFETLVTYLKDIGIKRFDVDASDYDPDAGKVTRPDKAAVLKRAHEAAAYDAWFRNQVQAAIDDPRPRVPHDQAKARFAARKAALRQAGK